jgi:hypothetical protein
MGMEIHINVETIKSHIKLIKTTEELKVYYTFILDEIRDLEFKRDEKLVNEKIVILEDILDMIGSMLLTAAEDC